MSGDPRTNTGRWGAWPARTAPPAQEDLNPVPQAARASQNATGRGRCGHALPGLTPRQVRSAARASNHAVATAPHTRREQANMRAALTVARELLRCRLMESGRDALLERVAELLDAAASGAPPFCSLLTPQAAAGSHGGPRRARVPTGAPPGFIDTGATNGAARLLAPRHLRWARARALPPTVWAGCNPIILKLAR
mgnify:CR=1 FL=1